MPASNAAILKNIERLKDGALIDLWNRIARPKGGEEPTLGPAWTEFLAAADELRLADKIPGSVGRAFRAKYAEVGGGAVGGAGPKDKRAATAASGPAPASAGRKAGGAGRSSSKAAQVQKEAAK